MSTIQATPIPTPPQRGWWSRNWLWFVPTVLIGCFLLCAGVCTGLGYFGFQWGMKNIVLIEALGRVTTDPQVIERLGDPITLDSKWPAGEMNIKNGRGEARYNFTVRGPKGTANVRAESRLADNNWQMTVLEVTFADGTRLNLDTHDGDASGDAPKFNPGTMKKKNMTITLPKEAGGGELKIDVPDMDAEEK